MVPTSARVSIVGCIGKKEKIVTDKTIFFSLTVAVKRKSSVMRPDGKVMDADWYKVVTNIDCSQLDTGDYVAVEGQMVVRYWTKEEQPTKNYRQDYEVRADRVDLVEDDTKKETTSRMVLPSVGKIMSSSLG